MDVEKDIGVGALIAEERSAKGWTQKELAEIKKPSLRKHLWRVWQKLAGKIIEESKESMPTTRRY